MGYYTYFIVRENKLGNAMRREWHTMARDGTRWHAMARDGTRWHSFGSDPMLFSHVHLYAKVIIRYK